MNRHTNSLSRGERVGVRGVVVTLLLTSCIESTGGNLVSFHAQARGVPEASHPFTTPAGFDVSLTRARVHVGALYFNQQNPQSYTLEESCLQDGVYSGEVRAGLDVDALNAGAQPFPLDGNGTDALTRTGTLWLTGGDLFATDDATVVLDVAGTATGDAGVFPFEGQLTIGANRQLPPRNAALPGSNPLCAQRIVGPVAMNDRFTNGGTVTLVVDARQLFAAVDFSTLASDGGVHHFTDSQASDAQADLTLFSALRSAAAPWRFEVTP